MSKLPDGYWSLLEDAFDKVSIYNGHQTFIAQAAVYPEHIRHLLAAHWCQSEICNGGFTQFFANSTGMLAKEAAVGMRAMDAVDLAVLIEQAVSRFGPTFPTDREARNKALHGGLFKKAIDCRDLDNPFFESLDRAGGFDQIATRYAERFVDE